MPHAVASYAREQDLDGDDVDGVLWVGHWQVAFYVESYSLQRQKVYSRHEHEVRKHLPPLCGKRKAKPPKKPKSFAFDDWYGTTVGWKSFVLLFAGIVSMPLCGYGIHLVGCVCCVDVSGSGCCEPRLAPSCRSGVHLNPRPILTCTVVSMKRTFEVRAALYGELKHCALLLTLFILLGWFVHPLALLSGPGKFPAVFLDTSSTNHEAPGTRVEVCFVELPVKVRLQSSRLMCWCLRGCALSAQWCERTSTDGPPNRRSDSV